MRFPPREGVWNIAAPVSFAAPRTAIFLAPVRPMREECRLVEFGGGIAEQGADHFGRGDAFSKVCAESGGETFNDAGVRVEKGDGDTVCRVALLALGLCWGRRCLESQSGGETVGNLWRCHACIVSGSAPGAMRFECAGLCVSAAPRLPLA